MKKFEFNKNAPEELTLFNVKVEDVCLKADGQYTPHLTINVHDLEVQNAVKEWVRVNDIGKKEPGTVQFSGSGDSLSYWFKLTSKTEIIDRDSNDARSRLEDGAIVTLTATAYAYDNSYGRGVGQKLLAVLVHKAGESANKKAAQRLANLACRSEDDEEVLTPEDTPEIAEEDINLDEIPF